ncbi:MAG: carbohydrate-binding domain-containing protein [Clostridia bacterium]|nr:carbohydrate-binding domain-containing protein [Clostridia bacterium]
MKRISLIVSVLLMLGLLVSCGGNTPAGTDGTEKTPESSMSVTESAAETEPMPWDMDGTTHIGLSDTEITVNGEAASTDSTSAVYTANDIVYYEAGHDFTYGEGTEADSHTADEAASHTVVHITAPGTYTVSGKLSAGQIAVDLGEDAEDDPEAVVTLILDGADVTCTVAPAVIFYSVYECGSSDTEGATKDVDTAAAGANVIVADGSVNNINGSYVARIYKPDTVVLSDDGLEVEDAKKLHKYDAAFYSKQSLNVNGGETGDGVLNITAENEGLDSELHLTVNGGNVNILSGNDGINTNEDGVSVTTVNGGVLNIKVTGETGEGDGIDSNGWLVINGGTVIAQACAFSADAGIDSDMGIHVNGGTVIATGAMLDRIEDGGQNYAVFNFAEKYTGGVTLKNADGTSVMDMNVENSFTVLVCSSPELTVGTYTLWCGDVQMQGCTGEGMMGGMGRPEGMTPPEGMERPEGEPPEGFTPHEGEPPEGMTPPEGMERPEGEPPFGMGGGMGQGAGEASTEFVIADGGNEFSRVCEADSITEV